MKLDDWFETYERDGGELMLFNSLDMEAAYKAGHAEAIERAANIHDSLAIIIGQNPVESFWNGVISYRQAIRALKEKV